VAVGIIDCDCLKAGCRERHGKRVNRGAGVAFVMRDAADADCRLYDLCFPGADINMSAARARETGCRADRWRAGRQQRRCRRQRALLPGREGPGLSRTAIVA